MIYSRQQMPDDSGIPVFFSRIEILLRHELMPGPGRQPGASHTAGAFSQELSTCARRQIKRFVVFDLHAFLQVMSCGRAAQVAGRVQRANPSPGCSLVARETANRQTPNPQTPE